MDGLADIHNHLLWGLDDGCRTPGDTLELARALAELGYDTVAASPHAKPEYPSGDPLACEARRAEVARQLGEARVRLELHLGAENYLDDAFLARALDGRPRGVGPSQRYALVELPHHSAVPALPDVVFRLKVKGVTPLFAHPERCAEFQREGRAQECVKLGAFLQLDVGALTGRYGKDARKVADRLLDEDLYAVAASDVHGPVGVREWLGEALKTLEKRAGAGGFARLCNTNPRRIIAGEELA